MNIIINADDFGIDLETSKCIIDFIQQGICDTTSVMTNMAGFEETADLASKKGILDRVGLHINLTEGVPITDRIKDCDAFCMMGKFGVYKNSILSRVYLSKIELLAVREEICAQIERYRSAGYSGLFFDSHQGIHMDPSLEKVMINTCEQKGFIRCRNSPNMVNKNSIKEVLRKKFDHHLKNSGLMTTDYFGNLREFVEWYENENENAAVFGRSIEIMTHPKIKESMKYIDASSNLLLEEYETLIRKIRKLRIERRNII